MQVIFCDHANQITAIHRTTNMMLLYTGGCYSEVIYVKTSFGGHVVVLDSFPLFKGVRFIARLTIVGIEVALITKSASILFQSRTKVWRQNHRNGITSQSSREYFSSLPFLRSCFT